MKFGDYLRQRREKQEWTQPEAASKIQIEQSYLSKLETGKSLPSDDIFSRIVDIYGIDVSEMYSQISPGEIEKLKDLHQIRQIVIQATAKSDTAKRRWLLAGLLAMIMGGAFLAASFVPDTISTVYTYRSEGVLSSDEDLWAYNLIKKRLDESSPDFAKKQELLGRLDQSYEESESFKGNYFVQEEKNGRRFFQQIGKEDIPPTFVNRWFLVPGLMLLLGGISCFYISRRWN